MRYLLMIYEVDRAADTPRDVADADLARYAAFTQETRRRNAYRAGEALEPTSTATTVRIRDGKRLVTDGPFAETKEFLGGFYLLECRDLDEAIELATMIPAAERGSVEIRPIWELPAAYTMADPAGTAAG